MMPSRRWNNWNFASAMMSRRYLSLFDDGADLCAVLWCVRAAPSAVKYSLCSVDVSRWVAARASPRQATIEPIESIVGVGGRRNDLAERRRGRFVPRFFYGCVHFNGCSAAPADVGESATEACPLSSPTREHAFSPLSHEFARHDTTQHDHSVYVPAVHFSCTIYTSDRFSPSNHGVCVFQAALLLHFRVYFQTGSFQFLSSCVIQSYSIILFEIPKVQLTDEGASDSSLNLNVWHRRCEGTWSRLFLSLVTGKICNVNILCSSARSSPGERKCEECNRSDPRGSILNAKSAVKTNKHTARGLHPVHTSAATAAAAADNVRG